MKAKNLKDSLRILIINRLFQNLFSEILENVQSFGEAYEWEESFIG